MILIAVMGVVNLYSATSPYLGMAGRSGLADFYVQQVYWLVLGGMLAMLLIVMDYRTIERFAYILYGAGVFSLILLFVVGDKASDTTRGSTRWLNLGFIGFQPSEFMKVGVVLALARYLADDAKTEARGLLDLIPPLMLIALPVVLVMLQPDFGTSMIYLLSSLSVLALARIQRKTVSLLTTGGLAFGCFMWFVGFKEYQRARITSFLNPEADKDGDGWHAFQAQTAVGNGGVFGEGFREGTQNQSGFLPDQYSDFPYAVFGEDWGFVGCVALLGLYCFVALWAIRIAAQAKDRFGAAAAVGMGATLFWQTFFNVGMAIGVLPVVGVPLPLFSYGGSGTLTVMAAFGVLMSISLRR